MWCVNPMVVDTWKADPYPYPTCEEGAEADENDDKVGDRNLPHPLKDDAASFTRSTSCGRIHPPVSNRKPKRSLSVSGGQGAHPLFSENIVGSRNLACDPQPKEKLKRSNSVLTRLARQYSLNRTRRNGLATSKDTMSSGKLQEGSATTTTALFAKDRSPRRRRNKSPSKNDSKALTKQTDNNVPSRLGVIKSKGRIPSPMRMRLGSPRANCEGLSSPDSCPSSPSYLKTSFATLVPTITETKPPNSANSTDHVTSADESPLPSPSLNDKSYDSGQMSMSSVQSFSSGRPTSISSVTSSISSRTSRGSDYFSSASSTGPADQHYQMTSYRPGLQTVLPDVDESESVERSISNSSRGENECKRSEVSPNLQKESAKKISRSATFKQNANLNEVDHLAPVANLAMVANPELSYVDRIILELLETERMYVRSLRDILTGYLAVIRSTPELNIHPNDVDDLFGNIRDVYDFNRNLLGELEDCCGDPRRIAECFVSKDEDFKVYTEYCTNYPSSVAAMTRCMQNPNLVDFFKGQQEDLRHTLPLGSYLLKPVQRILKYHLMLQELVKHCHKGEDGYQTIQNALLTMTKVARHINDMKRKHEDAVHIQEIQSLLTNWQGNELTTYGELILESEVKMQGAKNERQAFLFEKMILITKRREDGYLVCKANIMCSNLVLLESLPNTPLGFQIQPFAEKAARAHSGVRQANGPPDPNRVQRYILLAPSQQEKRAWTYNIKKLIIETMRAAIPIEAQKNIMRMRAVRDGDVESEDVRLNKKSKSRFGSSAILGSQDGKTTKSALHRLTGANSSTISLPNAGQQSKQRWRTDSMPRKGLHKRALQKRKDEIESNEDVSADSAPSTPSGLKIGGKFSFPSLRQGPRSCAVQQPTSKVTTTRSQPKRLTLKVTNDAKKTTKTEKESSNQNGEVVKRHHNSVIYRRHKRRTSQPITITEKRLSMKLSDDDEKKKDKDDDVVDDDDLMNFNPLAARESVSWDIQIVEAVFERYKKEGTSPVTSTPNGEDSAELESTYLTVPSDVAPAPLISLDHTPLLSERRKSRIFVVPSSDSSEDETAKKKASVSSGVVRRRKSKSSPSHRTSGVAYALSQDLEVESDSEVNETRAMLRKVVQASESARKSLIIHESDTETEKSQMLIEKANAVRRGSLKCRERKAHHKNSGNISESTSKKTNDKRNGSGCDDKILNDRRDVILKNDAINTAVTSSMQCMSTPTISMVDSKTKTSTEMVTVQSSSVTSITSSRPNDVSCANSNHSNNSKINNVRKVTPKRSQRISSVKDMKHIPTGKVKGLIERMWSSAIVEPSSIARRKPLASPAYTAPQAKFSFQTKSSTQTTPSVAWVGANSIHNNNNNNDNNTNSIFQSKEVGEGRVENVIKPLVATGGRSLTITSSSSSSDGDNSSTIMRNVQRLHTHEHQGLDSAENAQNPPLCIRRTFSEDVSNPSTRGSTNVLLETRTTGRFDGLRKLGLTNFFAGCRETGAKKSRGANEDFKFEAVNDAKHHLMEKLCLRPPSESKVTDKMSEEFEHVCCEEDGIETSRNDTVSPGELPPPVSQAAVKNVSAGVQKEGALRENSSAVENLYPVSKSDSNVEQPKICGSKNSEVGLWLRKYGQQYGRSILPSRADSIRSTRSEYASSRLPPSCAAKESNARGRSVKQEDRNSSAHRRFSSKDMKVMQSRNVARLTKQFTEIAKAPERLSRPVPRRSRSVGEAERRRQRMHSRHVEQGVGSIDDEVGRKKQTENSKCRTASMDNISAKSWGQGDFQRRDEKNHFERASVKVEEMCVCKSVEYSSKMQTATEASNTDLIISNVADDDVFSAKTSSPTTLGKKTSLIQMFAANPLKIPEFPKEDNVDSNKQENEHPEEKSTASLKTPGNKESENTVHSNTASVRVILVPRSNNGKGRCGLEPRVLHLSPTKSLLSPPPLLEKQKSWTNLSSGAAEAPERTRLRSSSLTRARRRGLSSSSS